MAIRVLHIVGAMYPGGMENFIMNLYQNIDREKIQFDFVVHARKENDYIPLIESMGGKVYEVPRLTKTPIKSLRLLKRIVKDNNYPVVIRHTANALVAPQLMVAKQAGAKTVCHSHNETDPKQFFHKIFRHMLYKNTDIRLACSDKAGKWMYKEHSYKVINNAIDINKFSFDGNKAQNIINEFNLKEKNVYGHIANFIESKNHMFLMEIFAELIKIDPNARCFCLGEGDLRPQIEAKIKELDIEDKVTLTGIRYDVDKFMSAMDILVFPSLFEGLPLTLIEAQVSGLPIQMSDTITPNVVVTDGLVEAMSLNASASEWARRVYERVKESKDKKEIIRECQKEMIAQHGYDLSQLADWYQNYLITIVQ